VQLKLSFRSRAAESPGYRADIDGLRAIAVLAVIFYHAGYTRFSGGFVGVDIFFVISGYLITRVLEDDMAASRFSFWGFYDRRMRRIFPALFAVALACAGIGFLFFPSERLLDFGRSLLAMAGFVSNVYFQRTSPVAGYFGDTSGAQLLLHTWSLSVEEQFYVLFPVALLILHRFARGYRRWIILAALLLSLTFGIRQVHHNPVSAFYLLPGRAWELLVGAALSITPLPVIRNRLLRNLAAALGLAAIVYAIMTFSAATPFPGTAALWPCLGAALLIYSGEGSTRQVAPSLIQSALGLRPLVLIGTISYSLYLWHWPLIVVARSLSAKFYLDPERLTVPLLIALVLAILSFEFVESPFRNRRQTPATPRKAVWIGLAGSTVVAALAMVILLSHGLPHRFSARKMAILDINYAEKKEFADIGPCANFKTNPRRFTDVDFCSLGHAPHNILFWGDSHVSQLYPTLQTIQQQGDLHGKGIVFAVSGACPPVEHINVDQAGFHCDAFAQFAHQRALQDDIDTVFIQFCPWWVWYANTLCITRDGVCVGNFPPHQSGQGVVNQLSTVVAELKQRGKRVIVGLPFPYYDKLIPDFEIRTEAIGRLARYEDIPFDLSGMDGVREQLIAMAAHNGVQTFDPRETLCPDNLCVYSDRHISRYSDQSHLATSKVIIMRPALLRALDASPAPSLAPSPAPVPPPPLTR
jgi:peptidoglycan/LPS O-acetylase OafA/YrhL